MSKEMKPHTVSVGRTVNDIILCDLDALAGSSGIKQEWWCFFICEMV